MQCSLLEGELIFGFAVAVSPTQAQKGGDYDHS